MIRGGGRPPLWRRLRDLARSLRPYERVPGRVVFLPHNAYHTANLALCVPALEAAGVDVCFVDVGAHHYAEGAGEAIRARGLPCEPYSADVLFRLRPSLLVVMNDWGGVVGEAVREANRLGVVTVGLVEGVQDFEDTHVEHIGVGYVRRPYRTVRHAFLIGAYDRRFVPSDRARVVGLPRVEGLYRETPVLPKSPLAVINSNFTYELYTDDQPAWLAAAVAACQQAGIDYVISQHHADHADLSAYPVSDQPLHALLRRATLVISRFSTVILEAMALGKPVVYFNPHGERMDTFRDPLGAFPIATDLPSLRAGIATCLGYADRYPEVCRRFLHHHVSLTDVPAGERVAKELLRLLRVQDGEARIAEDAGDTLEPGDAEEAGDAMDAGPGPTAEKPLTVVVCTYNRRRELRACLDSLLAQTLPGASFDIVVVDNGSTDGTAALVDAYLPRGPIRYLHEPELGLSRARNRGIAAARSAYVAFLDDDARAAPDWAAAIVAFARRRPEAVLFGGPVLPLSGSGEDWPPQPIYSHQLDLPEQPIAFGPQWLAGSNLVVKRAALGAAPFDTRLGMNGRRLGFGEEIQLQARLVRAGHALWYSPDIRVEHGVTGGKERLSRCLEIMFARGACHHRSYFERPLVLRDVFRLLRSGLAAPGRWLSAPGRSLRARTFAALEEPSYMLGSLVTTLRGLR